MTPFHLLGYLLIWIGDIFLLMKSAAMFCWHKQLADSAGLRLAANDALVPMLTQAQIFFELFEKTGLQFVWVQLTGAIEVAKIIWSARNE